MGDDEKVDRSRTSKSVRSQRQKQGSISDAEEGECIDNDVVMTQLYLSLFTFSFYTLVCTTSSTLSQNLRHNYVSSYPHNNTHLSLSTTTSSMYPHTYLLFHVPSHLHTPSHLPPLPLHIHSLCVSFLIVPRFP